MLSGFFSQGRWSPSAEREGHRSAALRAGSLAELACTTVTTGTREILVDTQVLPLYDVHATAGGELQVDGFCQPSARMTTRGTGYDEASTWISNKPPQARPG